jgi:uncharacterized protein YkuJ
MAGNKNTAVSTRHSVHGKPGSTTVSKTKNQPRHKSKTKTPKKSKISKTKVQRRRRDDEEQTTTFPEVEGKVVREVMFSHADTENTLVIDFEDHTALSFEIDPEPLVLPLDVRAQYLSDRQTGDRRWQGLAGKRKSG